MTHVPLPQIRADAVLDLYAWASQEVEHDTREVQSHAQRQRGVTVTTTSVSYSQTISCAKYPGILLVVREDRPAIILLATYLDPDTKEPRNDAALDVSMPVFLPDGSKGRVRVPVRIGIATARRANLEIQVYDRFDESEAPITVRECVK